MSKRTLATMKQKLLADPGVKRAYEAMQPEFDLARELIAARSRAGLSQAEVAERMGTTQSVVARIESGTQLPSMRTIQRYALATGSRPVLRLVVERKKKAGEGKTARR